jgi:hypothetical protein
MFFGMAIAMSSMGGALFAIGITFYLLYIFFFCLPCFYPPLFKKLESSENVLTTIMSLNKKKPMLTLKLEYFHNEDSVENYQTGYIFKENKTRVVTKKITTRTFREEFYYNTMLDASEPVETVINILNKYLSMIYIGNEIYLSITA